MARRKVYTPAKEKSKKATVPTPKRDRVGFPSDPIRPPMPAQPKLEGFTTPELEEIEGAIEAYKAIEDRVKDEKKELTKELDKAAFALIETLVKHKQKSISLAGWVAEIVTTLKVKVKGTKKLKAEREDDGGDEFRDKVGRELEDAGIRITRL